MSVQFEVILKKNSFVYFKKFFYHKSRARRVFLSICQRFVPSWSSLNVTMAGRVNNFNVTPALIILITQAITLPPDTPWGIVLISGEGFF